MKPKYKTAPFFPGSTRQWKAKKRKEWKAIVEAFETFRLGGAYTPVYPVSIKVLDTELKLGTQKLSVKEWGR